MDVSSPRPADAGPRSLRQHGAYWALLAVGAVLVLVAGLTLSEPRSHAVGVGAGPRAIRGVDLADATYPTAACPEVYRLPGTTFTLVDGRAGSPPDLTGQPWPGDPRGVDLHATAYGDVDGDGAEEAAVVLRCYRPNSDALSRGVVVVDLIGDRLVTLAALPTSGTPATGTFAVPGDGDGEPRLEERPLEYDLADEVAIAGGRLVVRWRQSSLGGDALGQGYDVTVTYRIDEGGATIEGEPTRVVVPFPGTPGPG